MKKRKSFLRSLILLVASISFVLFLSFHGTALAYNVAYIYGNAEAQNTAPSYLDGHFDSVTNIDGDAETLPSLAELMAYDAIMVSPNWPWTYANRSDDLGNLLADYVDAGGGLVMTMFSWQSPGVNDLRGRLLSGGYSPFVGGSSLYSYASLGTFSAHPIMSGVNTVEGYFRDGVTLSVDAQSIATWSDGVPFVAIDTGSGVVGINLFPEDFYEYMDGDYATLFINALNWAAEHKKHSFPSSAGQVVFIDGIQILSILNASYPNDYSHYLLDAVDDHWAKAIEKKVGQLRGFEWSRTFEQEDDFGDILYAKLEKYSKENTKTGGKLVVVAHSWGTVLAYEAAMRNPKIHIDKLITLGSPLNARNKTVKKTVSDDMAEYYIYSISHPDNVVAWVNYWAQCDPVSGNISAADVNKKIKTSYMDPETRKKTCHSAYYKDDKVWKNVLQDIVTK